MCHCKLTKSQLEWHKSCKEKKTCGSLGISISVYITIYSLYIQHMWFTYIYIYNNTVIYTLLFCWYYVDFYSVLPLQVFPGVRCENHEEAELMSMTFWSLAPKFTWKDGHLMVTHLQVAGPRSLHHREFRHTSFEGMPSTTHLRWKTWHGWWIGWWSRNNTWATAKPLMEKKCSNGFKWFVISRMANHRGSSWGWRICFAKAAGLQCGWKTQGILVGP